MSDETATVQDSDGGIRRSGLDATPHEPPAGHPLEHAEEWFDVREFARTARGSHRDALDLAPFEQGLEPDAARLLRALRDLERTTMQRMRNLLVTATHKDARVTAFLTTWAYEKFWLADALTAVLDASGAEQDLPATDGPRRHDPAERADRRGPIRRAFLSNLPGADIVGAHVSAGLVDEWITSAAYRRLAAAAQSLGAVVELAQEIKDRHLTFLAEEARRRLAGSERVQRFTRAELRRQAWPIGAIERSADERSFFERIVFGGPEGRRDATAIGRLVAELPGIGSPVGRAVESRLVP